MVKCLECGNNFRQITNRHLKYAHNLTPVQYREKYPDAFLFDDDILSFFKERSKKYNEKNKGVSRSNEVKEKIRQTKAKKEIIPWNKGIPMKQEQKLLLSKIKIENQRKRKESGIAHPLAGVKKTEDCKKRISESVIKYAKFNRDLMKNRAKKAVNTKIINGFYSKKRSLTIEKYEKNILDLGFDILEKNNDFFKIKCQKCNSIQNRCMWSYHHERMCRTCNPTLASNNENEFYNFLVTLGVNIIRNDKSILQNNFEIDFLLPDYNLGIEYNGLYWHSEKNGKSKFYHLTKRNKCLKNNIKLIQIFEDEWLNKQEIVKNRIKAILRLSEKTYARNGIIKKLSTTDAKAFVDLHHIYGYAPSSCRYGLYINSDLEAVMTFTKPTKAKNQLNNLFDYELSRYCSKGRVLGGASKIFKHFLKEYKPTRIVSYADLRWGDGDLYKNLGFKFLGNTMPNYWYTLDYKTRIYRFKLRKDFMDDQNLSEWGNRLNQGYDRIWDCGHSKWVWEI